MLEDFGPTPARSARRFGASLAASASLYAAIAAGVVVASTAVRHAVVEDELVQVTFAPPPSPAPAPPPPPPPPTPVEAPPPEAAAPARLGTPRPRLEVPEVIPEAPPPESSAPLPPPPDPFAPENEGTTDGVEGGVLGGRAGGTGTAVVAAAAPPPPEPAPRTHGPMRVPEGGHSPELRDATTQPRISDELRASGLQTVRIVVRVVVDEDGRVRECTVLRGHPLLPDASVEEAVRSWRFDPARTAEGTTFVAIHTLPITIRIAL